MNVLRSSRHHIPCDDEVVGTAITFPVCRPGHFPWGNRKTGKLITRKLTKGEQMKASRRTRAMFTGALALSALGVTQALPASAVLLAPLATVALTSPADGSIIAGFQVPVSATATNAVGVQFKLDGVNFTAERLVAPYSAMLDASSLSETTHTISAVARNADGVLTTVTNTVTVNNTRPEIPTVGVPTRGHGSVSLVAHWTSSAANGGTTVIEYGVKVYIGVTDTPVALPSGGFLHRAPGAATSSVNISGLTNGTAYSYVVFARNMFGSSLGSARSALFTPTSVPTAPRIGVASSGVVGNPINATARWAPPVSNGGLPITSYRVTALRMNSNGTVNIPLSRASAVLSASARSLVFGLPAGNYRFTVVATNAIGVSSAVGPAGTSARSNLVNAR